MNNVFYDVIRQLKYFRQRNPHKMSFILRKLVFTTELVSFSFCIEKAGSENRIILQTS